MAGYEIISALDPGSERVCWSTERLNFWVIPELAKGSPRKACVMKELAELDYLTTSRAATTVLAENYVGLPWTD
jgi:p-hydroxybenzoate 3-monooxygenase